MLFIEQREMCRLIFFIHKYNTVIIEYLNKLIFGIWMIVNRGLIPDTILLYSLNQKWCSYAIHIKHSYTIHINYFV